MATDEARGKYEAPAAICAADTLLAIARSETSLTARQIAESTGHTRSLVYRTAKSLLSRGFLDEVETGTGTTFRLGVSSGEVGGAYQRAIPFEESIRKQMRRLSEITGETVSVGRLEGVSVRYLMREEGQHSVVAMSHVGKQLPAHAAGIGKALLSQLDDATVLELFNTEVELRQLTSETHSSTKALLADLDRVRERGYAVERNEVVEGRSCIAAPVPGREIYGSPIAISVSMPELKFVENETEIAAELTTSAEQLRQDVVNRHQLGGRDSLV